MATNFFIPAHLTQQRFFDGVTFPTVLTSYHPQNLDHFLQSLMTNKSQIESLLHASGAVLFKGFPVNSAADFDRTVEAFGYEEQPYIGGAAPRTNVLGRVFTANESPPDQKIPFHHEMSQVPEFPSKIFFYCEEEPKSGGETSIVLSHHIYNKMRYKHPKFVEKLEEHGLLYIRVLGEGDDPSSCIGRGWHSTFLTKDKNVAEERASRLGVKIEWIKDGAKIIMGPIPAIKFDETHQRKIWFNAMAAAYTAWKDSRNEPSKTVKFGDGSPLPVKVMEDCLEVMEEECVSVPWRKGDVILLDNWAVLHSRRSFEPPRRILASLCK